MIKKAKKNITKKWKRINMRNVDHLIGAEFIHNLYNQHVSRINSIRFRNTKVTWKNGQVNSFAPEDEWNYLKINFGQKFINLDKTLLEQLDKLLNFDRNFLNNFENYLSKLKINKKSNKEISLLLIDLQNYTLGELYSVNLVQIEQALTYALNILLSQYKNINNCEVLSKIIVASEFTEAQKEEIEFFKIVAWGRKKNFFIVEKKSELYQKIFKHYVKFSHLHCAYGELPRKIDFYFDKYKNLFYANSVDELKFKKEINERLEEKKIILKKINNLKIKKLAEIMTKVGVFRDYNKARLGQIIKYRLIILDEIAKRKLDDRHHLNYYLLSEIVDLLQNGKKLEKKEINERKNKGVTFIRKEEMKIGFANMQNSNYCKKKIKGICASPGIVSGQCKVILSKNDMHKILEGDIMVAIGTDFDLMDAIQRSAAVITEEGGLLSHASVVCREMGKPCCIGVKNAVRILKDGTLITLNSSKGEIIIK